MANFLGKRLAIRRMENGFLIAELESDATTISRELVAQDRDEVIEIVSGLLGDMKSLVREWLRSDGDG